MSAKGNDAEEIHVMLVGVGTSFALSACLLLAFMNLPTYADLTRWGDEQT